MSQRTEQLGHLSASRFPNNSCKYNILYRLCLLCLAVRCFVLFHACLCPVLVHLLLNRLTYPCAKLRPVAECEQDLQPNEQRRKKEGLEQVIFQSRRASLKHAMANELRKPAANV